MLEKESKPKRDKKKKRTKALENKVRNGLTKRNRDRRYLELKKDRERG